MLIVLINIQSAFKLFFMFFNDNYMLLIYFQGLGLIGNDSTATEAETGAFMNHKPAAFHRDALNHNTLIPAPFLSWFPNKSKSRPVKILSVLCSAFSST